MMSYKRENLIKLLELIKEISNQPENEWFKSNLYNLFIKSNELQNNYSQGTLEAKINLIQKYLLIDVNDLIDYSFFDDPAREQLFRDNLEMMRYEKGTPNHKINFGEFCRYAHLQAEEMINYFLNKISDSKIEIVELFIEQYSSNYKPIKRATEIHHINYTVKLWAFKKAINLGKPFDTLLFINDLRNELSHRNSFTIQNDDKDIERFEKEGFLKSNIDLKKLSNSQKDVYNKGKYIIAKRKEDFRQIKNTIEDLKISVIKAIQNPPIIKENKITIGLANPVLADLRNKLDN
jgi:hypothetical protein